MLYLFSFVAALIAWLIGTTAAGGASIIFLLIMSIFLPIATLPLFISTVGTVAGFYRAYAYRNNVYWPILKWLLPGTICGSLVGAGIFTLLITQREIKSFEILLGIVLIFSGAMGIFKGEEMKISTKHWYFFPTGFLTAIVSGIIGAAPPTVNVLYQTFPLTPNQIVGTKSINLFTLQLTKSITYFALMPFIYHHANGSILQLAGVKTLQDFVILVIMASIGAAAGISLSKILLEDIDHKLFRQLMNGMLIFFGLYFVYL